MRYLMANGRIPRKSLRKHPTVTQEPLTPQRSRELIRAHRGWPGMRISGHLDLHGLSTLYYLPDNLTCGSLDISDCPHLTALPSGLRVTRWIEVAGSGLTDLPTNHGFILHWRGMPVSDRVALIPDSITGQDILNTENVELRRVLIERIGYDAFLKQVGGLIRDQDRDAGGDRQLVCIPFDDDEPLMMLKVICPSTGHLHALRVPPHMRTCHQAAAWVAGFDHPDDYHPIVES
ncbi:MAG: hypothetical protein F6K09_24115 [Merismopedia sp. SIO2A8]|nr:hypothetical protein [Merismopedia sp. SIO2A8]